MRCSRRTSMHTKRVPQLLCSTHGHSMRNFLFENKQRVCVFIRTILEQTTCVCGVRWLVSVWYAKHDDCNM